MSDAGSVKDIQARGTSVVRSVLCMSFSRKASLLVPKLCFSRANSSSLAPLRALPPSLSPCSPLVPPTDLAHSFRLSLAPTAHMRKANCSGLTPTCGDDLFRLVNQTLPELELYANFTAENEQCANQSFAPCWEGTIANGRIAQGSCTIDCRMGRDHVNRVCEAHGGTLCDTEFDLGLDGTEVKATWPMCLPVSCGEADLVAIQSCLMGHTCNSVPGLKKLLPECGVTLKCIPQTSHATQILAGLFAAAGLLLLTAILSRAGCCRWCSRAVCDREETNVQLPGTFRIFQSTTSASSATTAAAARGRGGGSLNPNEVALLDPIGDRGAAGGGGRGAGAPPMAVFELSEELQAALRLEDNAANYASSLGTQRHHPSRDARAYTNTRTCCVHVPRSQTCTSRSASTRRPCISPVSLCLDVAPISLSHARSHTNLPRTSPVHVHVLLRARQTPPFPSNPHPSVPLALLPLQGPHSHQRCVRARQTRILRRPHRRTRQWCDHSPALPRRAHCGGHRARPGSGQRGTA